jgi:cytochrome P450
MPCGKIPYLHITSQLHTMSQAPITPQPIKLGVFETLRFIRQSYNYPLEHSQHLRERFGDVVIQRAGRMNIVHLFGADAAQLCLVNPDQTFSNKKAWDMIIGRIFPNGLMLRDGADHRYHRRLMQAGFKSKAMQGYLTQMIPQVEETLASWCNSERTEINAYPAFKQMTLDLAATIFLGMDLGTGADKLNKAFEATVAASMPRIPLAIPGTILYRGIQARKFMCRYFLDQIATKRASNDEDLFALLCRAEDEEGNRYTDQEIVDHMIFLMMAAHDTTTSTLTSMVYLLARHPQWQDRLRAETLSLGPEALTHENLAKMTETDWVIKETLRLYPPLSTLPKFSNKSFEHNGFLIPSDALVITYPIHTHYMDEYWDNPVMFDPERFSPERSEHKRHSYSWIPFSGGAHMCIGLHFADIQIKLVIAQLLRRYSFSVAADYVMPVQQSPISKPKDNLPIVLERY